MFIPLLTHIPRRSLLSKLRGSGTVSFFKDFTRGSTVDADYAVGSKTGTMTVSRSSSTPATYIDGNGVIQVVTTSDVPRFGGGFYSDSGFTSRPHLMIESSSTNLLTRTDQTSFNGSNEITSSSFQPSSLNGTVTKTQTDISALSSIASSFGSRIQYSADPADTTGAITYYTNFSAISSVAEADVCTGSLWIRTPTSNSGVAISFRVNFLDSGGSVIGTSSLTITNDLTTAWKRFQVTGTAPASTSRMGISVQVLNIASGDSVDIEVYGGQGEKKKWASSWIPTTTAALTRNAENLSYLSASNRTGATETVFIKFCVPWVANDLSAQTTLLGNDGSSDRRFFLLETSGGMSFYARFNGDSGVSTSIASVIGATRNVVNIVACAYKAAGSNGIAAYLNGSASGTPSASSFTANTFGTNFYLGNQQGGSFVDARIQTIVIYSTVLDATAISNANNVLD